MNPIRSQDPMHGQPPLWNMILDEITEEQDRLLNQTSFISGYDEKSVVVEDINQDENAFEDIQVDLPGIVEEGK